MLYVVRLSGDFQLTIAPPISGASATLTAEAPNRTKVSLQSRLTEVILAIAKSCEVRSAVPPHL
jgi:hypothetical protein